MIPESPKTFTQRVFDKALFDFYWRYLMTGDFPLTEDFERAALLVGQARRLDVLNESIFGET